ncbi:MAG: PCYCGC domain-containing protein [Acidobacteria bacterium]|nr:PCYCGC domain-containing protein [Acidobacteriota bacterium]
MRRLLAVSAPRAGLLSAASIVALVGFSTFADAQHQHAAPAKGTVAKAKYPDTMDRLHCFCECKESPREHHKTLLTCFTNDHAAGCGICQHEALMAAKLKDQGASDEEVEITVEAVHKTDGHPPTAGRGN